MKWAETKGPAESILPFREYMLAHHHYEDGTTPIMRISIPGAITRMAVANSHFGPKRNALASGLCATESDPACENWHTPVKLSAFFGVGAGACGRWLSLVCCAGQEVRAASDFRARWPSFTRAAGLRVVSCAAMLSRHSYLAALLLVALMLLMSPISALAWDAADASSPAFNTVPELKVGFDLLYEQKFTEAREAFKSWESNNPEEPFGQAAVAASYLFEELYRQDVLSSSFFLDDKKFLHGIKGKPDAERMKGFREALARTRQLAGNRQKTNSNDGEALFALTLAAGMESDAQTILEKNHLDGLRRMKEANKYAKQLLAGHPDVTDAYIAPGIANYIIGSMNSGVRFALWFDGVHGDKKLGMEQVAKTSESGRYLQPFAKIILALAARREKQNGLAQELLRELKEQYPDNVLFATEYAKAVSAGTGD